MEVDLTSSVPDTVETRELPQVEIRSLEVPRLAHQQTQQRMQEHRVARVVQEIPSWAEDRLATTTVPAAVSMVRPDHTVQVAASMAHREITVDPSEEAPVIMVDPSQLVAMAARRVERTAHQAPALEQEVPVASAAGPKESRPNCQADLTTKTTPSSVAVPRESLLSCQAAEGTTADRRDLSGVVPKTPATVARRERATAAPRAADLRPQSDVVQHRLAALKVPTLVVPRDPAMAVPVPVPEARELPVVVPRESEAARAITADLPDQVISSSNDIMIIQR